MYMDGWIYKKKYRHTYTVGRIGLTRERRSTRRNTKQNGHPKQRGRQRRAGEGAQAPPRCLDNYANNRVNK